MKIKLAKVRMVAPKGDADEVDESHRGTDGLLGLIDFRQAVDALVINFDYGNVGFRFWVGVRGYINIGSGDGIEDCRLA